MSSSQLKSGATIFVTGASGLIGLEVTKALIAKGYKVNGLARSDASAKKLEAVGATPVRGSFDDFAQLKKYAAESDGVCHLAFQNDLIGSDFLKACENDGKAIDALCEGLISSGGSKPFVVTSGTLSVANLGRTATEDDKKLGDGLPRVSEKNTLAFQDRLRVAIVRCPPTTHLNGQGGFAPTLLALNKKNGAAAYVGDGANVWPTGNVLDVAQAYVLALEKAPSGTILHPMGNEGVSHKTLAEAFAKRFNLPLKSITQEQANDHFGPFFARVLVWDNPVSSAKTRALGWEPTHSSLLEDIENGLYDV